MLTDMIVANADGWDAEAWFVGPWNSSVPAAISFGGHAGVEPHVHDHMYEAYLVADGTATIVIGDADVVLTPGTILVVEPGETHHLTAVTADYRHFVIQTPFVSGDKRLT